MNEGFPASREKAALRHLQRASGSGLALELQLRPERLAQHHAFGGDGGRSLAFADSIKPENQIAEIIVLAVGNGFCNLRSFNFQK